MKHKSILQSLRFLTLLGLMVLGIGNAWGQTEVTINIAGSGKWTNKTITQGVVTITASSVGSNSTQTRWASGDNFSITAASGYKITKAEFTTNSTATYVSPLASTTSTYTGCTCTTSGTTATITVSSGYSSIVCTNVGGSVRVTSCKVTYESSGGPVDPTVTFDNGSVYIGKTLDLSTLYNSSSTGAVTYSITSGSEYASIENNILTGNDEGTVTVKASQAATSSYNAAVITATVTVSKAPNAYTCDFESEISSYTDWISSNFESKKTHTDVTAHGGSYFGTTGGKSTATLTTKTAIAKPKSITFYVTRQTTNNTGSNWILQTSENGTSWTDIKTQSAISMAKGTWVEVTQDLSSYTNVYVRIKYDGGTAVRNIDDVVLTYEETGVKDPSISVSGGTYWSSQSVKLSQQDNNSIYYTTDGTDPTSSGTKTLYESSIEISSSCTLKAAATDGETWSSIVEETYTIGTIYSTLAELVNSSAPTSTPRLVKVTLSDEEIQSINLSYGNPHGFVLTPNSKEVLVYISKTCPSEWKAKGIVSGTIQGNWQLYGESTWELALADYDGITYLPPFPTITTQPSSIVGEQAYHSTATFTVVAEDATSYQWYSCADVQKTNPVPVSSGTGYNAASFTTTQLEAGTYYYYCKLINSRGDVLTDVVSVTVKAAAVPEALVLSGKYPTTFFTDGTFSHEDMVVKVRYTGEAEATTDVTNSCTFSGYNIVNPGVQTVTVSYTENSTTVTTTYDITVTAVATSSIAVTGEAKTEYLVGDEFVKPTITATMNSGAEKDVTQQATFSGYDMSQAGNQTVTVTYDSKTATYDITVKEPEKYALVTSTDQLVAGAHYMIGSGTSGSVYFMNTIVSDNNRRGTSATVTDNAVNEDNNLLTFTLGGTTGAWTFATDNYKGTAGYLNATDNSSNNYLQIVANDDKYNKFSISFDNNSNNAVITCTEKSSRNIMRYNYNNGSPMFACYTSGQSPVYLYKKVEHVTSVELDKTSESVEIDGTVQLTATISPASASVKTVTWSSSNTGVATVSNTGLVTGIADGTATITVTTTDGGKTATCEVTVSKKSHTITVVTETSMAIDDNIDVSTLFTTSGDGEKSYSIVSGSDYATLSGTTLTATGVGTVEVQLTQAAGTKYLGATATATVSVEEITWLLNSITITKAPTQTVYGVGDTFNSAGMVVTATYKDATEAHSKDVDVTRQVTYSPEGALSTTNTEITVSFTDGSITKTATQTITVKPVYTITLYSKGAQYGDVISHVLEETLIKDAISSITAPTNSNLKFHGWNFFDDETTSGFLEFMIGNEVVETWAEDGNVNIYAVFKNSYTPKWELVDNASTLNAGDQVVFVGYQATNEVYYNSTPITGLNKYLGAGEATLENNVLTLSNDAETYTLGGNAQDGWTFYNGSKYISNSTTNLSYGNSGTAFTIEIDDDGKATIEDGDYLLSFNGKSPRFKTYSSSQGATYLYRYNAETYYTTKQAQSVTISYKAGWATVCLPFNATIGDYSGEVAPVAKYVTVDEDKLVKTDITNIKAQEGFLLKGVEGENVTVTFVETQEELDDATGNQMVGTTKEGGDTFSGDGTYYILTKGIPEGKTDAVLGFFWDPKTKDEGASANCAQYKAVLRIPEKTQIKGFSLDDDTPTCISDVDANVGAGNIYNLAGQKLNKLQKGINIVNGKKVYVQ